jgi:hypothetical protein
MKKMTDEYLSSKHKPRGWMPSFFTACVIMDKMVEGLNELVNKTICSMAFPKVLYNQRINFVRESYIVYKEIGKQLNKKNHTDQAARDLHNKLAGELKAAFVSLCPTMLRNINLNYSEYYLDALDAGFDIPSNDEVLKEEIISILKSHNGHLSKSMQGMITTVIETLVQDDKSINLYAKNSDEKCKNILKFVTPLQPILSKQNDAVLLPELTKVIDRAVDVMPPVSCNMKHNTSQPNRTNDFMISSPTELTNDKQIKDNIQFKHSMALAM